MFLDLIPGIFQSIIQRKALFLAQFYKIEFLGKEGDLRDGIMALGPLVTEFSVHKYFLS